MTVCTSSFDEEGMESFKVGFFFNLKLDLKGSLLEKIPKFSHCVSILDDLLVLETIPKGNNFIQVSNMMNAANAFNFQPYQNAQLQQNHRQYGNNRGHNHWQSSHF